MYVAKSWTEAKSLNVPTYHGKPCRKGDGTHGDIRYSPSGQCVRCRVEYGAKVDRRRSLLAEVDECFENLARAVDSLREELGR